MRAKGKFKYKELRRTDAGTFKNDKGEDIKYNASYKIHAVEFNFNSLLEDERINTAHNYYLMFVDVILIIGFINLLKNKFEEVTNK